MFTADQILVLSLVPKVGKKTIFRMVEDLRESGSTGNYFEFLTDWASENKFSEIINKSALVQAMKKAEEILDGSILRNVELIGFWDDLFPPRLRNIKNPPVLIHSVGDSRILSKEKMVAVIGTRDPSEYGYKAGFRISEMLAENNFTVVSGLAKGCDAAGHLGCLTGGGKTVAVLAHGLHTVYPKEHAKLVKDIVEYGGAVISEYPVGQGAFSSHFVERDRLQSGLSAATIVIETDIKGGTMHTVKFTQEEDKLLACLDHPKEHLSYSKVNGNQMLIKEQHAFAIRNAKDLSSFALTVYQKLKLITDNFRIYGDDFDSITAVTSKPYYEEKSKVKRTRTPKPNNETTKST